MLYFSYMLLISCSAPDSLSLWTTSFDLMFDACMSPAEITLWKPIENLAQVVCQSPKTATGQSGAYLLGIFLNVYLGSECFYMFVSGMYEGAVHNTLDLHELPMCFPCMSEILGRENMGLLFDASCSFMPGSNRYSSVNWQLTIQLLHESRWRHL